LTFCLKGVGGPTGQSKVLSWNSLPLATSYYKSRANSYKRTHAGPFVRHKFFELSDLPFRLASIRQTRYESIQGPQMYDFAALASISRYKNERILI
jgi:hypothetical protein